MSVDCYGDEERMKTKMREERREKWNEREVILPRPSKTPEGMEEKLLEAKEKESDMNVCEDGMKK